jgi:indolepyruvate ferredoxin oxidoreductase beta subunit
MTTSVLLCGVGGQGTILAAHVLAACAMAAGIDVKVSEIHGMSQRGGAVTTVVNFGENVHSMVCDKANADIVVSFEMLEALRNISFLKPGGTMISSDEIIKPSSVLTGKAEIPANAKDELVTHSAILVPAVDMALKAGNAKTSNVVLLGVLSTVLNFTEEIWEETIKNSVPPKTIDVNLAAFRAGRALVAER